MLNINTTTRIIPMMYAYTTPEIARHNGWVKIGYTESQTVEQRVKQQTHTSDVLTKIEWKSTAIYDDGSGECFTDHDFHSYLEKDNIERIKKTEWFKINPNEARLKLMDFKMNRGIKLADDIALLYTLREEQEEAKDKTIKYFKSHKDGEFLWNAKPRFGKTLASYDLCKCMKAESDIEDKVFNVLILTNRPAIGNSWYSDYVKFMGAESGFVFVSEVKSLKDKPYILTRKQYVDMFAKSDEPKSAIEFVSLQDLKGSVYFGGDLDKLSEVKDMEWDLVIIDEAHEGADTIKAEVALEHIKKKHTLHLSGTPFKALANEKFPSDAIFNWTYVDEQKKKRDWDYSKGNNPYEHLPKINMLSYQMSNVIYDDLKRGIEIDGETEEYAFDLNLFFSTNADGTFKYEQSVDKFLDVLTHLEKYPFSTDELRGELKHTLWILDRVASAKALVKKLKKHKVFGEYEIVLAAGDGKINDDSTENDEGKIKEAYDKVCKAIKENDKTITISVGQLTTGITIPEWTGVLMLANLKSPAKYMQAAFRAQNPWKYSSNGKYYIKENAYVFDFDPVRMLTIFEGFANDLCSKTSGGRGDSDARKQNVGELINFFPVIGEDENGRMVEYDAEKVLTVPRKIRSTEVVRRGFMSNFLFQNISNIFGAPERVLNIIREFEPEDKKSIMPSRVERNSIVLDENGDVALDKDDIVQKTKEVFGKKIYSEISDNIEFGLADISVDSSKKQLKDVIQRVVKSDVIEPIISVIDENDNGVLKKRDKKEIENMLASETEKIAEREVGNFNIKIAELNRNREKDLLSCDTLKHEDEINQKHDEILIKETQNFKNHMVAELDRILPDLTEKSVTQVEKKKIENHKHTIEEKVRDHLRGFSRTIPSFLMAYGDENTTLENFDKIIPNEVFREVTGITLEEFRFLRDGGYYDDTDTGENKFYQGQLFDVIVFNDSIKEFLQLKKNLADYFDEKNQENIFDYIPPQRTNQIYTPKNVVEDMVDMLEKENPGCFDDPSKTFADLYMKSGLYIAEIVKRLYNSPKIAKIYPNREDRLNHIFEKQVYGLAPTEIIYRIALSFVLGFDDNKKSRSHNLRMLDALSCIKKGTLKTQLDEIFD